MNAFELGRDLSQRNGFLPQAQARSSVVSSTFTALHTQVPTVAEILRELGGYYTAHSGGMCIYQT